MEFKASSGDGGVSQTLRPGVSDGYQPPTLPSYDVPHALWLNASSNDEVVDKLTAFYVGYVSVGDDGSTIVAPSGTPAQAPELLGEGVVEYIGEHFAGRFKQCLAYFSSTSASTWLGNTPFLQQTLAALTAADLWAHNRGQETFGSKDHPDSALPEDIAALHTFGSSSRRVLPYASHLAEYPTDSPLNRALSMRMCADVVPDALRCEPVATALTSLWHSSVKMESAFCVLSGKFAGNALLPDMQQDAVGCVGDRLEDHSGTGILMPDYQQNVYKILEYMRVQLQERLHGFTLPVDANLESAQQYVAVFFMKLHTEVRRLAANNAFSSSNAKTRIEEAFGLLVTKLPSVTKQDVIAFQEKPFTPGKTLSQVMSEPLGSQAVAGEGASQEEVVVAVDSVNGDSHFSLQPYKSFVDVAAFLISASDSLETIHILEQVLALPAFHALIQVGDLRVAQRLLKHLLRKELEDFVLPSESRTAVLQALFDKGSQALPFGVFELSHRIALHLTKRTLDSTKKQCFKTLYEKLASETSQRRHIFAELLFDSLPLAITQAIGTRKPIVVAVWSAIQQEAAQPAHAGLQRKNAQFIFAASNVGQNCMSRIGDALDITIARANEVRGVPWFDQLMQFHDDGSVVPRADLQTANRLRAIASSAVRYLPTAMADALEAVIPCPTTRTSLGEHVSRLTEVNVDNVLFFLPRGVEPIRQAFRVAAMSHHLDVLQHDREKWGRSLLSITSDACIVPARQPAFQLLQRAYRRSLTNQLSWAQWRPRLPWIVGVMLLLTAAAIVVGIPVAMNSSENGHKVDGISAINFTVAMLAALANIPVGGATYAFQSRKAYGADTRVFAHAVDRLSDANALSRWPENVRRVMALLWLAAIGYAIYGLVQAVGDVPYRDWGYSVNEALAYGLACMAGVGSGTSGLLVTRLLAQRWVGQGQLADGVLITNTVDVSMASIQATPFVEAGSNASMLIPLLPGAMGDESTATTATSRQYNTVGGFMCFDPVLPPTTIVDAHNTA